MKKTIHDKYPWIKKLAEDRKRERFLAMSAKQAYEYAVNSGKRVPELEQRIVQSEYVLPYAIKFFKEPWPAAEPYILKEPYCIIEYARVVLGEPWPAGEEVILKKNSVDGANAAYRYARDVLCRPWPEAEKLISINRDIALNYANLFNKYDWLMDIYTPDEAYAHAVKLGRRCKDLEPLIATEASIAYSYALNILRKRFPAGEAAIKENPLQSYYYAFNVVRGRWPEGEPAIKRHPALWNEYQRSIRAVGSERRKSRPKNNKKGRPLKDRAPKITQ